MLCVMHYESKWEQQREELRRARVGRGDAARGRCREICPAFLVSAPLPVVQNRPARRVLRRPFAPGVRPSVGLYQDVTQRGAVRVGTQQGMPHGHVGVPDKASPSVPEDGKPAHLGVFHLLPARGFPSPPPEAMPWRAIAKPDSCTELLFPFGLGVVAVLVRPLTAAAR